MVGLGEGVVWNIGGSKIITMSSLSVVFSRSRCGVGAALAGDAMVQVLRILDGGNGSL